MFCCWCCSGRSAWPGRRPKIPLGYSWTVCQVCQRTDRSLYLTHGSYQIPLAEGTAFILIRQNEERDSTTYTTLSPQSDGSFTGELWFLDERGAGVQISVQTT